MAILQIFTTYLYAMTYGEPEPAKRIGCLDRNQIKSIQFYLSVFTRKSLEMSLFFIYCASLAFFYS